MRHMSIFVLALVFLSANLPAYAEEEGSFTIATGNFQQSLLNLKASVDELSERNELFTAQNAQIKTMLLQLRMQLGLLSQESETLAQLSAQMHGRVSIRGKQIAEAQRNGFELQGQIDRQEAQIKVLKGAIAEKKAEDLQLSEQMNINLPAPVAFLQTPNAVANNARKDKLKLMKMIYDSQQRQGELQGSIGALQKTSQAAAYAKALANRDFLKDEIKKVQNLLTTQAQSPAQPKVQTAALDPKTQSQMKELETQINILQKNQNELQGLVEKMQKKSQAIVLQKDVPKDGDKLRNDIEELNKEEYILRGQMDRLRTQMVDLDKRKTILERMLHKT